MLTYRPVQQSDINVICGFPQNEDELFFMFPKASFPLTPAQLETAIAARSDSTVVELEGRVVGFANFYRWEQHGICSIGNVVISPCVRGRGIGQYLITHMVKLAFARYSASEVTIACFNRNVAGLLLYSKLGFQPVSIEARSDKSGNRVALINLHLLRNCFVANPTTRYTPYTR